MVDYESLPDFTSEKPCPRCGELLHWSSVNPPKVEYNTRTGKVWFVTLTRFCIGDGYMEQGVVNVNQDPVWRPTGRTEQEESEG